MNARIAALAAALIGFASSTLASAQPMNPAIERLVVDPRCRTAGGVYNDANLGGEINPDTNAPYTADEWLNELQNGPGGRRWCKGDDAAFARLINQYGFAFAPTAMHSARTTGYGGFHLSLEAAYTKISDSADYWENGTQGTRDPNTNQASIRNSSPQSLLQLYSLKFRKGFGFGLELTGAVGFMPKTSILSGGADVRMSLLEGFRTGVGGILPDIAVGGGVRTITGTSQFQLTTVGIDGQISKPLPIADSSIITPWVGYQYLFIFGDSGLVDLTPGTDAIGYCNYTGGNLPGNADPDKPVPGDPDNMPVYDGQPVCEGGTPLDFNNNTVFDHVRLRRQRLLAGLNYRYEMVMVGGQFIMDLIPPADAQVDDAEKDALEGEDKQWTLVFELGGMF
ncbi:MAG TPA: hypothetical protein VM686_27925 [Polyangiaceae bacterium]|nr:hypothetical protein [Polyangiaceae bacterium]